MQKMEDRNVPENAGQDFELGTAKSEVAVRLDQAIRAAGGPHSVSSESGVPLSTVNNYWRGITEPKALTLAALAEATGVRLDWLLFGREPMRQAQEQEHCGRGGSQVQAVSGAVEQHRLQDFAFLPRYAARAAAGAGQLAVSDEITENLAFRRDWLRKIGINPTQAFLLLADGDSMEPTIPDGSLMLVDGSISDPKDIRNGAIYVIVRAGVVIVKRVQFKIDDSVVLISDNPIYERETISRQDMNDLHFAGRVVWFGRAV